MCAIAGMIGNDGADKEHIMSLMLASMKHRGPDHSAVQKVSEGVILGHNRLSIIDLQPTSNQPFTSYDGRYTIVFNGEIYNYLELRAQLIPHFVFYTQSDTEVLLAAYQHWGHTCLERLVGMFSFAIWDKKDHNLFAARDRFGVKPFYYAKHNQSFVFASEIKALWAGGIPKLKNHKVWASFFAYGSYGAPDETFWQGADQLPGGHYLIWQNGKLSTYRWYHFEKKISEEQTRWSNASATQITEGYLELLHESIDLRFRADVPVGFNISGGLDSSLLLALIKEKYPQNESIQAFSFYTGDTRYDELPWVNDLIATTHFPLYPVLLEAAKVPELAEKVSSYQDEPYGGIPTLAYSEVFRKAKEKKSIVLLDGQGIDEAWAGYDYYQTGAASLVQGTKGSPLRPEVLEKSSHSMAEKPEYPNPFNDPLLDVQYRDIFYTKIPRALRFNDRISMMHSTELREPFLDHRLVEMAFALPRQCKIDGQVGKYLLRNMAKSLLPESIREAPKRPLQTPQREWLGNELKDWAEEKIKSFAQSEGINAKSVLEEWEHYKKHGGDNSFYIWQYINASLLFI